MTSVWEVVSGAFLSMILCSAYPLNPDISLGSIFRLKSSPFIHRTFPSLHKFSLGLLPWNVKVVNCTSSGNLSVELSDEMMASSLPEKCYHCTAKQSPDRCHQGLSQSWTLDAVLLSFHPIPPFLFLALFSLSFFIEVAHTFTYKKVCQERCHHHFRLP